MLNEEVAKIILSIAEEFLSAEIEIRLTEYFDKRKWKRALKYCSDLLAHYAEYPVHKNKTPYLLCIRGLIHLVLNHKIALEDFDAAVKHATDNNFSPEAAYVLHAYRCFYYIRYDDVVNSIKHFNSTLNLYSQKSVHNENLCFYMLLNHMFPTAELMFQRDYPASKRILIQAILNTFVAEKSYDESSKEFAKFFLDLSHTVAFPFYKRHEIVSKVSKHIKSQHLTTLYDDYNRTPERLAIYTDDIEHGEANDIKFLLHRRGMFHYNRQKYKLALADLSKAISLFNGTAEAKAISLECHAVRGIMLQRKKDFDAAHIDFLTAFAVAEELGDVESLHAINIGIAETSLCKQTPDFSLVVQSVLRISDIMKIKFDKALHYIAARLADKCSANLIPILLNASCPQNIKTTLKRQIEKSLEKSIDKKTWDSWEFWESINTEIQNHIDINEFSVNLFSKTNPPLTTYTEIVKYIIEEASRYELDANAMQRLRKDLGCAEKEENRPPISLTQLPGNLFQNKTTLPKTIKPAVLSETEQTEIEFKVTIR